MILTNTRFLLAEDAKVQLRPSRKAVGEVLCDYCGANMSCERPPIFACQNFTAPLLFQDTSGTEGNFSTFRSGLSWSKRLKPGKVVGLVRGRKEKSTYGFAVVARIHTGMFVDMMSRYAETNHLMIAENLRGEEAAERLTKVVRQIYGPKIIKSDDMPCTIISLVRLSKDRENDFRSRVTFKEQEFE